MTPDCSPFQPGPFSGREIPVLPGCSACDVDHTTARREASDYHGLRADFHSRDTGAPDLRMTRERKPMTTNNTTTTPDLTSSVERPSWGEVTATVPTVTAAVWCSSVGTTWTIELHTHAKDTAYGTLVKWITSGIPTSHPLPDALAYQLLAACGLHVFPDLTAGPSAHSRHRIGYASADAKLIALARTICDEATETGVHPLMLAAQRIRRNNAGCHGQ
jgi:hypothetical protein